MSLHDFERLTPDEFAAVYNTIVRHREFSRREAWEQCRMQALFALAPYSKKKLAAADIMVFPWEQNTDTATQPSRTESRDYILKRFQEAKKRHGLK